ncbi:hypothetical protein E4U16_004320 [Claviceps sp. LM84 group G4]|nr:hypothetical protein E4U16_004320 [Claviceps sp. LM84 group G4]
MGLDSLLRLSYDSGLGERLEYGPRLRPRTEPGKHESPQNTMAYKGVRQGSLGDEGMATRHGVVEGSMIMPSVWSGTYQAAPSRASELLVLHKPSLPQCCT